MAATERPFEAYRGDGPFLFVSYAHADAESVYPDLVALRDAGFNVYYDEGISPGSRWTSDLADAIQRCSVFVAFLSPDAVASENCSNEIEFAVSRRRPMLVVHAQPTTLPAGLELSLGSRQALLKTELTQETYQQRLVTAVQSLLDGGDPALPPVRRSGPQLRWALAAIAGIVAGLLWVSTRTPPEIAPSDLRAAVAVRPFDTTGVPADQGFFANGIADDLIMRLGRWRTLPVIARGSSFADGLPEDPSAIGHALDARYVLEGSVRGADDRLTISVYLVDAEDGRNVWSQEFDTDVNAVLSAQNEMADAIVAQINPALISAETRRALRADPANLDAWSAAMRGWWYLNTETREGLDEAQDWFRRAATLDPAWGWPHAALALSAYRAYTNSWVTDQAANNALIVEAANRAIELDPQDAFAHHALGHAYAMQGQIQESLDALERGVELSPNDAMANGCYAMQLAASAMADQALAVVDHAMTISPDDPWQHRFALVRARAHFAAAAYSDAETWALRSLQLKPNSGAMLHSIAAPALDAGLDRARERTEQMQARGPLPPLARIEQGFTRSTDPDYVARLLEGLSRAGFQ